MSHGLLQLEKAQSRELFLTLLNVGEEQDAMDAFDKQRAKEDAKSARRELKKRKKAQARMAAAQMPQQPNL